MKFILRVFYFFSSLSSNELLELRVKVGHVITQRFTRLTSPMVMMMMMMMALSRCENDQQRYSVG